MTAIIAVTQRVMIDPRHGERRDALDQRWHGFLAACGMVPLLLPNLAEGALAALAAIPVSGILLTGGNTLVEYGGDAPERDRTEREVLAFARARQLPVMGVCRGMQVLLHTFGVPLQPVTGHVATLHEVTGARKVNSFHDFGVTGPVEPFTLLARAADGVAEAVCHPAEPIHAIMWHPERCDPFAAEDIRLFRQFFLGDPP